MKLRSVVATFVLFLVSGSSGELSRLTTELLPGLHIGGKTRAQGWTVLDALDDPHVDVVGNIEDLSMFGDGSFRSVYASHVLEHLELGDPIRQALNEVFRVLAPGGVFFIGIPDMKALARLLLDTPGSDQEAQLRILRISYGGHTTKYDYHYLGLTLELLESALKHIGFRSVVQVPGFDLFDDATCLRIDGVPVSLNVMAVK